MTADATAQLVLDLVDAWNSHDLRRVEAFYAPDYHWIDVGQARPATGPRARAMVLATYVRAFPDVCFSAEPIVEGDRAALIWTMRGTHRGPFMGIPPTGRSVEIRGVSIVTVHEGRVRTSLNIWDTAGLLRALGLLPDL